MLAEAQAEFQVMRRDTQARFKSSRTDSIVESDTASMESALKAIGDSLTKRGISVRQPVIDHPTDRNVAFVQTILAYKGYEEVTNVSIRSAYSHSMNGGDVTGFGAEVSLVRKYALFAALGLVQENKDASNDGNAHGSGSHGDKPRASAAARQNSGVLTADQVKAMFAKATDIPDLCKVMNSIPMDVRKDTGAQQLFNERRMQLQDQQGQHNQRLAA